MRVKRGQSGVGWLDAVERDGGEVLEQGLEAVRWVVVAGPVGGCFGRGSPRSPRAIPGLARRRRADQLVQAQRPRRPQHRGHMAMRQAATSA